MSRTFTDDRLLNPKEIAYLLNVSVRTITGWASRWKQSGGQAGVPAVRIGKLWRFRKHEVLGWVETGHPSSSGPDGMARSFCTQYVGHERGRSS
jgi:excisionase family DNA binding protein